MTGTVVVLEAFLFGKCALALSFPRNYAHGLDTIRSLGSSI